MVTLSPMETAATKVFAKAQNIAARHKIVTISIGEEKKRQKGRLSADVVELVASVDEYNRVTLTRNDEADHV